MVNDFSPEQSQHRHGVLAAACLISLQQENDSKPQSPEQRQIMGDLVVFVAACGQTLIADNPDLDLNLKAHTLARELRATTPCQVSLMMLACRAAYAITRPDFHTIAGHDLIAVAVDASLSPDFTASEEVPENLAPKTITRREDMLLRLLAVVGREILIDDPVPELEELRVLRRFFEEQSKRAPWPAKKAKAHIQLFRETLKDQDTVEEWITTTLHTLESVLMSYDAERPSWAADACFGALLAHRIRLLTPLASIQD
jgi:hypothetical protein